MLRTGRRTVSTSVRDNAEITIVGELPPQTAKRIAENIKFGQRNDQRVGYRRLLAKTGRRWSVVMLKPHAAAALHAPVAVAVC